jgi:hypothetical protein
MNTKSTPPLVAVVQPPIVRPDFGPASPVTAKAWRKKGCELGQAAKIIVDNDDVGWMLEDEESMPVSVALLGMIYGVTDDVARDAVIHWLRRPNTEGLASAAGSDPYLQTK